MSPTLKRDIRKLYVSLSTMLSKLLIPIFFCEMNPSPYFTPILLPINLALEIIASKKSGVDIYVCVPFEPSDQDSIEDLLTLTEQEIKYWEKRGLNPNYIYEMAENGWEKHIDLLIN